MLVVDLHALSRVDALDFGHEVLLDRGTTADREYVGRVQRTFVQLGTDFDLVTGLDDEAGTRREACRLLSSPLASVTVTVADFSDCSVEHLAGDLAHLSETLRLAGLEQLDHSGQTLGDVLSGDTTGVEGTHRELGSRLADRLGGNRADRIADLHQRTGGRAKRRNRSGKHRARPHT